MNLIEILMIAFSLSVDAFILSISLSTFKIKRKNFNIFSIFVLSFHFILPILGMMLGNLLNKHFMINSNILSTTIFLILAITMFIDYIKDEKQTYIFSIISLFFLALSVSIDSFSIGLILDKITIFPFIGCLIISISAYFFSILGFNIGKKTYQKVGDVSKIVGIILMTLLAIVHIFK